MGEASYWLQAAVVVSAFACGIGALFLVTQERTRTNIALGINYIALGAAFATSRPLVDNVSRADPGLLARLQGMTEVSVVVASAFYLDGLRSTAQVGPRSDRAVRRLVRCVLVLTVWHAIASFLFPAQRLDDYLGSVADSEDLTTAGFWLFATSYGMIGLTFITAYVILSRQRLDPAEAGRARASAVAVIFIAIGTASPPVVGLACVILSMLLFLWGQLQYTAAEARHGVFLSRFLSRQVTRLVRAEGFAAVTRPRQVELTVVACDLRDFTPYAEAVPSQAVVDLLTEYYDAVGEVVARHGGTITNYAGDGILVLVGAPLPRDDHAAVGIDLARDVLAGARPVLARWSTKPHPIGIGVGVASGTVTVGTIGASDHMEYTAVGLAVNLASRLCSAARSDEVLVDERTVALAGREDVVGRGLMPIKGLSEPQAVYSLEC